MIGAAKTAFGGYTLSMLVLAAVNSLCVVYFAVLLPFLPAKRDVTPEHDEQTHLHEASESNI